jgi:hypothetical protein
VGVGSHRRTEAVVVPVEVRQASASIRAEGLSSSSDADAILQQWAQGEISTVQMRERVRRLHGLR